VRIVLSLACVLGVSVCLLLSFTRSTALGLAAADDSAVALAYAGAEAA
jgi:hypothetical protein